MAQCPICGGDSFQMMTRTLARRIKAGLASPRQAQAICSSCGARPRARLIFSVMEALDLLRPEKQVLHFAPEPPLFRKFKEIYNRNYTIGNLSMEAMSSLDDVNKMAFDMCSPSPIEQRFEIVIHSHVLEHVYCNWALALMRLNNLLSAGGTHLFCIPVHNQSYYKEDLDPGLPESVRIETFGKNDHVRKFAKDLFLAEIRELCRLTGFEVRFAAEVLGENAMRRIRGSGHVFVMRRAVNEKCS